MERTGWGLLLLDKPVGLTSHTAVRKAARFLGIKKSGHAGTLDPLASGLMLVGLGKGTRLLEYLVGCDKSYDATIRLGVTTDTLDREGEVLSESAPEGVTEEMIREAITGFIGEIDQIPPVYSSIKQNGVPLHRRARRGEEVKVSPRRVRINGITFRSWNPPSLEISVSCSSGTYIRSLARDIGDKLGVGGALWELRRTSCANFQVDEALTLETLEEIGEEGWNSVLPPGRMVEELPARTLIEEEVATTSTGGALDLEEEQEEGLETALFNAENELVAISSSKDGKLKPRKVFI